MVYIKSNACRVIHADGAYGGVTTQLLIYMALYSEHNMPPDKATIILDRNDKTAREEPQPRSNKVTREIETEVMMSLDVARALRDWLAERLAAAEKIQDNPNVIFSAKTENTTGGTHADSN
jgi:hypothetical protein